MKEGQAYSQRTPKETKIYVVGRVFNHFLHKELWTSGKTHVLDSRGKHKGCYSTEHSVWNLNNLTGVEQFYGPVICK